MQLCRVISWLPVNGFSSVRPFWKGFLVLYNFYFIQPECQSSGFESQGFQTLQYVNNKKYNTMKTFVIATMLELENNAKLSL